MASVKDYTFTGYGVVSSGSSVKMFMGTDQQFFLGGKNAMTIGTANTFTAGIKTDVMVGPAVSMGIAFSGWDATKGVGLQGGHLTAKYDFSTNKSFAFQIAEEGSSNYVTQSKFICEKGFQAVGGFQPAGQLIYSAYKSTISSMGKVVAVTNFLMAIQQIAQTLESPELKKEETLTGARALWAQILPGVVAGTSAGVITGAAIYAAVQRETNFKTLIHPQSVIDLTKTRVFLGALGNGWDPTQQDGASLTLAKGKATLGARTIGLDESAEPYTEKFDEFKSKPTSALAIDSKTVISYASASISIAAGSAIGSDPMAQTVKEARTAFDAAVDTAAKLADEAFDLAMKPIIVGYEEAQRQVALKARENSLLGSKPAIIAAHTAYQAALKYHEINPSLFLSAGSKSKSLLSKIEATAPNFNVVSNSISLSPDTPVPLRGVFVEATPATNTIKLVQGPKTNEILMDEQGTTLKFGVSEIQLKPTEIVIQNGTGSLSVKSTGLTFKVGAVKVEITPYNAKFASGIKGLTLVWLTPHLFHSL